MASFARPCAMSVSMGVVICFKTWMSSILRRGGGGEGGRGREEERG